MFKVSRLPLISFMLRIAREELKVIKAIICYVMIYMMNYLRPKERTSQMASHYESMLHNITIFSSHAREFRRTTDIFNARCVFSFPLPIRYASLPRWIFIPSKGRFLPLFDGWRIRVKLCLSLSLHPFRSPSKNTEKGAQMAFILPLPCVGFKESFTAIITDCIRGARFHKPIIAQVFCL